MLCKGPWTPLHLTFPSGTSQGRPGDHSRRTPRIILLASRVILLCDSFWLWRYKSTLELNHTSAHTFLNDVFQNFNSHVFMNVEIFSKKESSCHQLHTGAWGNSQFQAQVRCSISEYIPNCERQETSKRTGVTLHQVPEVEIFSFSILLRSPHFARQMQ